MAVITSGSIQVNADVLPSTSNLAPDNEVINGAKAFMKSQIELLYYTEYLTDQFLEAVSK